MFLHWLSSLSRRTLQASYDSLLADHRSLAIELSRSEQSTLDLRNENDRLREEMANRPTRETVDLLKTQVDHLALRYERRQVYGTLGPISATTDTVLSTSPAAGQANPPFSTNRIREATQSIQAALREKLTDEYQQRARMGLQAYPPAAAQQQTTGDEEKAAS